MHNASRNDSLQARVAFFAEMTPGGYTRRTRR